LNSSFSPGVIQSGARDLLFIHRHIALLAIALVAAFSLSAQEPVPLAHGNMPGEPHHHLKIENEYVRVYYVEVPPHENTFLHQHDHDYLFVTLSDSDVVNAVRDKPEVHLVLKDGETHFTRGGFAHVARNQAYTPFRNITIELLKPQEEARNVCGPVILDVCFAVCDPAPGSWSALIQFETAEFRLDHVVLLPKGIYKEETPKLPFLVVGLGGPEIKINAKGKSPETIHEGDIDWFDPGSNVRFSYEGTKSAQFLKLTFKGSAAQEKP
jgi:hypothetical protein